MSMENPALARAHFYMTAEDMGMMTHQRQMIARDIPGEYKKLLDTKMVSDRHMLVFHTRDDIKDICQQEAIRLQKMTGVEKKIDYENVELAFLWKRGFHYVPKVPQSDSHWRRLFDADIDGPCIICMERNDKIVVCGNCYAIICLECDNRIENSVCPACTVESCDYSV